MVLITAAALFLTACGGNSVPPTPTEAVSLGDPVAGKTQYDQLCVTCHGPVGEGMPGLGKPFTTSEFVASTDDMALLAFVKTGRPISNPANTTGIDMPPKGGNPALTDEDILNIIAYIRTLHQ